MHTVLKDLQISGMAARLMMWLHARSCVLPSFEWTSSNYHCSLPDSAYRQQQALLDHQTWLQLKDTRSDNFLHSRTKNAVILVLPGPKITPDQKFRDSPTIDSTIYGPTRTVVEVEAEDDLTMSFFLEAAISGNVDKARELLKHGRYDVNCTDEYGRTPLHWACCWGRVSMVRMLISELQADTTLQDKWGNTPLHIAACEAGREEVALTLITEFGCDTTIRGRYGKTLLHSACEEGCLTLAKLLIRDYDADINAQDESKNTPLYLAAIIGKEEVVLTLITEFGCDTTIRGQYGRTLLHRACLRGCLTLAKLLIRDYNADINAQDENKDTPLHLAARYRQHELFLALISEFGWDVTVRNKNGDTILGIGDVLDGSTILHTACASGNTELVNRVYKHVSPLATNDGDTFLHYAAARGRKECVEALLQLGAPIMLRNAAGKTARDIAYGDTKLLLDAHITRNQAKIYVHYNKIIQQAKKKYSNAERLTRVFVIGNPGAGKSSFIETMKREGFFESFSRVSESSAPLHTAGIVPSIHTSKHYGRAFFYDFAGDPEYYSSHAAILENIASSKKGENIFIIIVDLTEDIVKIENILHYWVSFIQHQNFMTTMKSILVIGSHSDLLTKERVHGKREEIKKFSTSIQSHEFYYFTLDCRKPRSKQLEEIRGRIIHLTKDSPRYVLSPSANALLGLLEKDFSNVTACSAQTILSHIKDTGVYLPKTISLLMPILEELHDLGLLFTTGDSRCDSTQVILSISQLTSEVHKLLFSKEAKMNNLQAISSFNIGILPQPLLDKFLPQHITKECLIQLQYCQEISQHDVGAFSSLTQSDSSSQSFLFFPALCTVAKSDISWIANPGFNYSIGWLARCANSSCDYFPPRFLHVLLLRLVFRFTLPMPAQHQADTSASPDHSHLKRRCTMWNCGVHWSMEEGVECMVELVNGTKGVVVIINSKESNRGNCTRIFRRIISCVMEAKAEFCYSIRPQFFLLDPAQSTDCINEDHLFAMSDVERVLASRDKKVVLSVTGKRSLECENLDFLCKFTLWSSLFPLDFASVLHKLQGIVQDLYSLGVHLNLPRHLLDAIEADFSKSTERRRTELVRVWMSSSPDPPCWWNLVQALKLIDYRVLAKEIETEHGKFFTGRGWCKYNQLCC